MAASQDSYAQRAIPQVHRLLSLEDRNVYSPTYGCMHRDYWLFKTSDFPDAVRQFGAHALALVYKHDFPGSVFCGQPKIRDWAIAALDYWTRIQHKDGSFDEFYPYERGWVGPTAFTTFTAVECYRLLQDEMPKDVGDRVRATIRRAAYFIAAGESEEDHLANHHAMACLATWKAYELLAEPDLKKGFEERFDAFLTYHQPDEGWSREYDGIDPGYLSATVSFLGKVYQTNPDPRILEVLRQSVEMCSYFVYPNGFYAGSMGSRNTLHFYPHGFEIMAEKIPLAAAVAEKMLGALGEGKLVPPEIQADRYVHYRTPEFLQAYLDWKPRPAQLPELPYEHEPFRKFFPKCRVLVLNRPQGYCIANLAKGGVVKAFDRASGKLLISDCGLIGRLTNGRIVSTQWIDPDCDVQEDTDGWRVSGRFQMVPANKLFTPLKNIIFRTVMLMVGWRPGLAHWIKGRIRKTLILGQRPVGVKFERRLVARDDRLTLTDTLQIEGKVRFASLSVGDEFFVRYVPQSRYFQAQELDVGGLPLDAEALARFNERRRVRLVLELNAAGVDRRVEWD